MRAACLHRRPADVSDLAAVACVRRIASCCGILADVLVRVTCKFSGATVIDRLVEQCLEQTVARYVAAMVTYIKQISDDILAIMQKDSEAISSVFEEFIKPEKVRSQLACCCPPYETGRCIPADWPGAGCIA